PASARPLPPSDGSAPGSPSNADPSDGDTSSLRPDSDVTNAVRSAAVPLKLSTSTGSLNPATVPVAGDCQNVQRVHGGVGMVGHRTFQFATQREYGLKPAGPPSSELKTRTDV